MSDERIAPMWLRKEKAGGSSTGHVWDHDGAVVEVDDAAAAELLEHSKEFSEAPAPTPAEDDAEEPGTEAEGDVDADKPKRKYTRRAPAADEAKTEITE